MLCHPVHGGSNLLHGQRRGRIAIMVVALIPLGMHVPLI